MILRFERHGLVVELDPTEVFTDDPGQGTPVMVYWPAKKACATYWSAFETGEVEWYELSDKQLEWLDSLEPKIHDWFAGITRKMKG